MTLLRFQSSRVTNHHIKKNSSDHSALLSFSINQIFFFQLLVVLYLSLSSSTDILVSSTKLEDKLETEIDPRPPRSFTDRMTKILAARQEGFHTLTYNFPDGTSRTDNIGNWEVWVTKYWYETRMPNTSCPQLPTWIATTTDWALMIPCLFGNTDIPPRTIFVNTYMLPHFIESTLHFMDPSYRFVLVSSGSDMTVPRSLDFRFKVMRGFSRSDDGGSYYQMLLKSPQLIHWFAENHDMTHPKISTLPTGMSTGGNPDSETDYPTDYTNILPVNKRPMRMLVSDRVRTGTGTWALRAEVLNTCKESLTQHGNNSVCLVPEQQLKTWDSGVPHDQFVSFLLSVGFVACVRGGGYDPSPKAWESIRVGTIPIIQVSTIIDAYEHFPVVFIEDWKELINNPATPQLMQIWADKLAPFYEPGSELRKKVLERLTTAYWVEQINRKVREYDNNVTSTRHERHSIDAKDYLKVKTADEKSERKTTSRNTLQSDGSGIGEFELPRTLGIFHRNGDRTKQRKNKSKNKVKEASNESHSHHKQDKIQKKNKVEAGTKAASSSSNGWLKNIFGK